MVDPVEVNVGRVATPAPDRFWPKVQKTETCWLWTAGINCGYGIFRLDEQRRTYLAHRFAYEELVGPIPDGLQIDHLCRVRHCVNPAHLEPVTSSENNRRAAAARPVKTHCPRGHEFTRPNVMMTRSGRRKCRTCHNAASSRVHRPNWRKTGRSSQGSSS